MALITHYQTHLMDIDGKACVKLVYALNADGVRTLFESFGSC